MNRNKLEKISSILTLVSLIPLLIGLYTDNTLLAAIAVLSYYNWSMIYDLKISMLISILNIFCMSMSLMMLGYSIEGAILGYLYLLIMLVVGAINERQKT